MDNRISQRFYALASATNISEKIDLELKIFLFKAGSLVSCSFTQALLFIGLIATNNIRSQPIEEVPFITSPDKVTH